MMESYESAVTASLFKNYRTSLERIEKIISPVYFTDINLYGRLYPQRRPIDDVFHAELPTECSSKKLCHSQRPSYAQAIKLEFNSKVKVGDSFGPTWASHWFKVHVKLPEEWIGTEVHLRWNSGSEALIWSSDGKPLQGLNEGSRTQFIISKNVTATDMEKTYYIEMACNSLFGAGNGLINPPVMTKTYRLDMLEIATFNRQVYDLILDLETLHDIAKELKESNRGYQALYTANQIINNLDYSNEASMANAHQLASAFFSQKNGDSQLNVVAIGNCHIDSAWLWPYGESIRKCARSWSSTIRLLERTDLNVTFACSQAQQFDWVKSEYPKLFQEIQHFAQAGKFVPVGGTWVEMDANIPSGESFIRQFLYGQKFFKQEFNKICQEFWLPDTFGYSAQIPQIIKLCGAKYFLSQKLSWSLVNKFPHNTFLWEGIDGTQVIAHFPPANTYTSSVTVADVMKTASNLGDKGRVSTCMLLYGHGDGGGGPDEDMCQRIKRLNDVDGCPKVNCGSSELFFSNVETSVRNLNCWVGELYLELHNGTYTTQALMKFYNRKCEFYLQQLDFLSAILALKVGLNHNFKNIKEDIEVLWKKVLLNQFHDVLPGSSIQIVHEEAVEIYKEVIFKIRELNTAILDALFGNNDTSQSQNTVLINTLPWERVERLPNISMKPANANLPECNFVTVKVSSMCSISLKDAILHVDNCFWKKLPNGCYEIQNKHLRVVVDNTGRIKSLHHLNSNKEAILDGNYGNQFMLYDDIPLYWDAWDVMDYHLETGKFVDDVLSEASLSPAEDVLCVELKVGENSSLKMEISLPPELPYLKFEVTVDWKENHKFLKVQFPVNVHADKAKYEIQFGHLERPTHFNTSWEWAKYEVCGHKWMDISEHDWGVAILNDCKYGHAVHKNIMRLSLLRAPKAPDQNADMGVHHFQYAIFPHSDTLQNSGVIKEAYIFNCPLIVHKGNLFDAFNQKTYFKVDHSGIIIETVKLASHENRAIVVRLYESFGGRCTIVLSCAFQFQSWVLCNGLEEEISSPAQLTDDGGLPLQFTPFEIKSILLRW